MEKFNIHIQVDFDSLTNEINFAICTARLVK